VRLATIATSAGSSAALVEGDRAFAVRELPGRDDAHDLTALIAAPLTDDEVAQLRTGAGVALDAATLLPPVLHPPKNVLCVGKNYQEHVEEGARAEGSTDMSAPKFPVWFTKAHTALIGQGGGVVDDPAFTRALDYEGELALVIGVGGRDIAEEDALAHVFGYSILNDITARDVQQAHLQWFRGKSADTYAPFGPWVVTPDELGDPAGLDIETRVNGEVRQSDNTRNLLFTLPRLISDISHSLTLEPGDVIATGTPSGVAWGMDEPRYLHAGDVVEVTVAGIGTLRNPVVAR
jgi:2-keto-4-pentenoate hydratase/2-oxohepta-3-ene-1,7-dioic acid hydratase in catechol pathway